MRIVGLFLVCAFLLNGYCAAAHAFGENARVVAATQQVVKTIMSGCHDMPGSASDTHKSHSPSKLSIGDCKTCCGPVVAQVSLTFDHLVMGVVSKLPFADEGIADDPQYGIFHPPKSLV